jgi:protein-disulfide isomerase
MAKLTKEINEADHILGPENAPVKLVEYGDFQCPYCGAAYPILQKVVGQMGDRLCFVYRNFPLTQIHEYAMAAAEAAEAAGTQGKFWEMHTAIFTHQDVLDLDHLYDFAQAIGLDMKRFEEDMATHAYADKVRDDFQSGARSGVNGTPTLFINGSRYDGPVEARVLAQVLEEAYQTA